MVAATVAAAAAVTAVGSSSSSIHGSSSSNSPSKPIIKMSDECNNLIGCVLNSVADS